MRHLIILLLTFLTFSCKKDDFSVESAPTTYDVSEDFSKYNYIDEVLSKDTLYLKELFKPLEECISENGYHQFSYEVPNIFITDQGNLIFYKNNDSDSIEVVRENITVENQMIFEFIQKYTIYENK